MYKDITSYSRNDKEREPSILENKVGGVSFKVHKHIYYGDAWLLSCSELNIDKEELHTDDIEIAKAIGLMQLVLILQRRIEKYENAIEELNKQVLEG